MNSNNWYHSHSFNFRGLTWEFTYIEATASRTIEATKPDGTKIYLKIPIKDTTKFAYPLAWLEKWEQSKGKRILLREKAESRTLFEMQLAPSKSPQGETDKTLLGVNENKEEVQLTPSKPPQGETDKTLLGVNENKEEVQLTPSKCLSCSFCQRISSILLTCLASPKYFTEETAKECERFTSIASKPEGNLEAIPKRPRRRRGTGSGTFITTYANHGKYGKKYPQISYQVEFGGKKRSIYVIAEKIEQIQELDRLGKPISEILEVIDSPKARKVLREYKDFLESKEEKN
ncbi:hypothetical protein [Microcystis aeruginosa]|uniref:Uncharacterized protein n=1 Tax=Microcystis aeruginosa NIES-3787 TaxID=2517782 RepID=A0A6H9FYC9_MICAE|nr:hypothetical protein [Microcystis aeruginosa]GCL48208.1 hypothetical protein NIES3787_39240 [Microcystis aeruginosa NIES-3787]